MTTTTATIESVAAEYLLLDASQYKLEPNIRTIPDVDDEFMKSIRNYGVLVPALAYRVDGQVYVRDGQRRYLAALETGRKLPAVVLLKETLDSKDERTQRIVEQLITNKFRSQLTTADTVTAVRQLELDGFTVTKIAGAGLGLDKPQVKAALTIVKSATAMELASQSDIDLLMLAAISEFEDYPEIVEHLLEVALEEADQFDHAVSYATQDKNKREAVEARVAELDAEGITTYRAAQLNSGEVKRLTQYRKDDEATVDLAAAGIGVAVAASYNGEIVDIPVAIDPIAAGYKPISPSSSGAQVGPMTDEQKAERRKIVRSNKAWDASVPVRADWLEKFVQRKQFPKDSAAFISIMHTRFPYDLSHESDHMAHDLLGVTAKHGYNVSALAELVEANPAKAGVVMLALTLGKLESGTNRDTWRNPSAASRAYLLQMRDWGYTLAPVELVAIGEATEVPDDSPRSNDLDEDIEPVED